MMFIKFVGRIVVGLILCLVAVLPVIGYIWAWKHVIESYDSIWDNRRTFFQNLLTIPDEFSAAFVTVHAAIAVHLGFWLFLLFTAWAFS